MPFAKTGGLADVAGALPKALRAQGVEATLILPLFQQIDRSLIKHEIIELPVDWRGQSRITRFAQSDASGAPAFLVDAPEYYGRNSIYGFGDDHERFAFFGRAALTLLRYI